MTSRNHLLVVERSQVREGLWRFGRADEPHSMWGLIERNEVGGVEVTKRQAESHPWRDDSVTALCLASMSSDDSHIEYDLSWRPVEEPHPKKLVILEAPIEHRETLGERAERLRQIH